MKSKAIKITYWISTGLLTLLMIFSASMYLLKTAMVQQNFETLGFPAYLVLPLAIAKILGLIAIWTKKSRAILEWGYAGFFFNTLLAFTAHMAVGDGEFMPALLGVLLVISSYVLEKKVS
ncbi:DoxX family protein [Labilibacter sediminis]|nr:DoxX family protein [Labilibacter sediminis]